MTECYGDYFILNGDLVPSGNFTGSLVYDGESVYEVMRIDDGIPVFFDDHYSRLEGSAILQGRNITVGMDTLKRDYTKLFSVSPLREANLRIVINYRNDSESIIIHFIKPSYPTAEQYRHGVRAILFHAERKDPESKVINHRLRSDIYDRLIAENAYEALLVDRNGYLTEGSRSNLFFILGDVLYTAPDDRVLSGITRKKLIEICREEGITTEFRCVAASEIGNFDGAFMTGTSPVVLPYCEIGDQRFEVNHRYFDLLRKRYFEKAAASRERFHD